MRIEAALALDVAASVAVPRSEIHAAGIPFEGAAHTIDRAHLFATAGLITARRIVSHVATAETICATWHEDRAHRSGLRRAGVIPFHYAAERVHRAHISAAAEIAAAGGCVCRFARACSGVAAGALRDRAVDVRRLRAVEVPAVFAAVLIECAHELAAGFVAAERRCVLEAAALCIGIAAIRTELLRPIDADLIPCRLAAVRIDDADRRAATRIVTTCSFVREFATSSTRRAAANTQRIREFYALGIPCDTAASRISRANDFAACTIAAGS